MMHAMMTAQKMATVEADLTSAPQTLVDRRNRPLIVAELINEAINGSVTLGLILVLQCCDDLIDPLMCIGDSESEEVSLHPVPLRQCSQDTGCT